MIKTISVMITATPETTSAISAQFSSFDDAPHVDSSSCGRYLNSLEVLYEHRSEYRPRLAHFQYVPNLSRSPGGPGIGITGTVDGESTLYHWTVRFQLNTLR